MCAQIICYALLPHYSKVIYTITLQASHVYYSIIIANRLLLMLLCIIF